MVVARAEKRADGGNAVGALAVLHHDGLAPALAQPFGDEAPGQVSTAAGRQRNDEPHGLLRPSLERRLGRRLRVRRPSDERGASSRTGGRGAETIGRSGAGHSCSRTHSNRTVTRPIGSTSNVMASSSGLDRQRRHHRAGDDDLARTQTLAESRHHIGHVAHDADPFTGIRLRIRRARKFGAAPNDAACQPGRGGAGARRPRAAEHHMTLVDIVAQNALGISRAAR